MCLPFIHCYSLHLNMLVLNYMDTTSDQLFGCGNHFTDVVSMLEGGERKWRAPSICRHSFLRLSFHISSPTAVNFLSLQNIQQVSQLQHCEKSACTAHFVAFQGCYITGQWDFWSMSAVYLLLCFVIFFVSLQHDLCWTLHALMILCFPCSANYTAIQKTLHY